MKTTLGNSLPETKIENENLPPQELDPLARPKKRLADTTNYGLWVSSHQGEFIERSEGYYANHIGLDIQIEKSVFRASYSTKNAAELAYHRKINLISSPHLESPYQTYYKLGVGWFLIPSEGFATISNVKHIQLQGFIGIDELFGMEPLYTEAGAGMSLTGVGFIFILGYRF